MNNDTYRYRGICQNGIVEIERNQVPCDYIKNLVLVGVPFEYEINNTGKLFTIEFTLDQNALDAYFERLDTTTSLPYLQISQRTAVKSKCRMGDTTLNRFYEIGNTLRTIDDGFLIYADYLYKGEIVKLRCFYDANRRSLCIQTDYDDV